MDSLSHYREVGDFTFLTTRIGDQFEDADRLAATSPALHADRVTAPVLLLHAEGDTTVPIRQSELMFEVLKKQGKQVEFIRMAGDDHYLSLEETRVKLLRETERFLAASIGH